MKEINNYLSKNMSDFYELLDESYFDIKYEGEVIIEFDCSDFDLLEIPESFWSRLEKCQIFNCSNNKLTILPPFPNCIELRCKYNKLKFLPPLPLCQYLTCCNNKLTELPPLPNIICLFCSYNNLTNISYIPKCLQLFCVGNKLFSEELDDWKKIWERRKSSLKNLCLCKIDKNQIKNLISDLQDDYLSSRCFAEEANEN